MIYNIMSDILICKYPSLIGFSAFCLLKLTHTVSVKYRYKYHNKVKKPQILTIVPKNSSTEKALRTVSPSSYKVP